MFFFMNRGLVIAAEQATFDTEAGVVTVTFSDPKRHGLLDGGHTYTVIRSYTSQTDRSELALDQQAFVRVELLEGFDIEQAVDIVDARNTSNQVKDQSLDELKQRFEGIKQAVAGELYEDLIAYKEYEVYQGTDESDKKPKPIDIREIVALLTVLNRDLFGDNQHPVIAYSQKAQCLNRFRNNDNRKSYEMLYPLLPQILRLWDVIDKNMRAWHESLRDRQGQGSRFGKITGVQAGKPSRLMFIGGTSDDTVPTAFKYPILAALRALLEADNGAYIWGKQINPEKALMGGLGEQLTDVVINNALEIRNPTKQGKTAAVWDQCYSKAQIWYLKA